MLGAGSGSRLRPLTHLRPKVLCPVGDAPLVDHAIGRVASVVGSGPTSVAVNARYQVDQVVAHVGSRAYVSDERAHPEELGTAGAVAALRPWLDGRPVLVVNGDTYTTVALAPLLDGWDGETVRVLVAGPPASRLQPGASVVASLVPAADARRFPVAPLGLSNGLWWPAQAAGRLEVVAGDGGFHSCGSPRDYLAANLAVSGGAPVIGAGAVVEGHIERCVVWPGATVRTGEVLVDAIRCDHAVTVLVRTRVAPDR